jgi:hypothetical protein
MLRTAGATLAAAGFALLCGQALSDDKVRLPRKGSSPGFEMRYDTPPRVPRQGNHAGLSREERERWERREREEREALEAWQAREERRGRRERKARLERQEPHESKVAHCLKLANTARVAQEEAKQKIVVGFLAGGLVGGLIASSQNDDAYKEPKVLWGEVYDGCMGKRQPANDRKDDDDDD